MYMSKNFLSQVLSCAVVDMALDDAKLEAIVRAVGQLMEQRGLLGEFIMLLAKFEFKGDCNCWRERTPLMLLHLYISDCIISAVYLREASKGLFKQIQWGGGGWAVAMDEFMETLKSSLGDLPLPQRYIMYAVYEASGRQSRALTLVFFLRFVLPYLTHPKHGHPPGSVTWPVKILSYIAGNDMGDVLSWPQDIREMCAKWRARMTLEDFFSACKDPYDPALRALRGSVHGLKEVLLSFVRPNLSKWKEDPETDLQKLADMMVSELLKERHHAPSTKVD